MPGIASQSEEDDKHRPGPAGEHSEEDIVGMMVKYMMEAKDDAEEVSRKKDEF